jgi:hypothetical protein
MEHGNLRDEINALMNGAYDVSPLKVDGKVYGNRYAPETGRARC